MNIFFHCGTPKTGSTSLQSFFNSSVIQNNSGLFYYHGGRKNGSSHHLQVAESLGCHPKIDSSIDRLRTYFTDFKNIESSCGSETKLVLSCEVFSMIGGNHDFKHQLLSGFSSLLGDYARNTRYCFYIRDPIDWSLSMFNQLIRSGRLSKQPSDFSADIAASLGSWSPDFASILDNYQFVCSEIGGYVDVRPFGRNQLTDGNIISDFLDYLGCDSGDFGSIPYESTNLATSLDARVIEGLLAYSEIIERNLSFREARELSTVMSRCVDSSAPTSNLFKEIDIESIFRYFSPIYSTIASRNWISDKAKTYLTYCASEAYLSSKLDALFKVK